MKSTRNLYRVHKEHAQERAEQSAKVIRGYFGLWNKRVKITVKKCDFSSIYPEGNPFPTPYDVKITTADDHTEAIAHAVGWAYLEGLMDGMK